MGCLGRPIVPVTEADVDAVCAVIAEHALSLKRACGAAGVSYSQLSRAVHRSDGKPVLHPEWYDKIDEARGKALQKLDELGKQFAAAKNTAGVTYITKQQFANDPRHRTQKAAEEKQVTVNIFFGKPEGGEPRRVDVVQLTGALTEGSGQDVADETDPD